MHIVIWLIYFVAAYIWADWRNWRIYYSTYLFMLTSGLFASVIMSNHTLWLFHPTFLLPNHTITEFFIDFVAYPGTVLLFLSRYPRENWLRQTGWTLLWIGAYTLSEIVSYYLGATVYKNGWSLGWSIFHNLVMFPTLRMHFLNPSWAWLISFLYLTFIWIYFGFIIQDLKYY